MPPLGLGSREQLNSLSQERPDRVVHNINSDSLVGVGGDVRSAFVGSSNINLGNHSFKSKTPFSKTTTYHYLCNYT